MIMQIDKLIFILNTNNGHAQLYSKRFLYFNIIESENKYLVQTYNQLLINNAGENTQIDLHNLGKSLFKIIF